MLKGLEDLYFGDRSLVDKTHEEINKIIDHITSDFENNIKPRIFSIELFWREIYSYVKLHPRFNIDNASLFDLVI